MAMTVRLAEELQREAGKYSAKVGLSINALIAVALREFLDRRQAAAAGRSVLVIEAPARGELQATPTALGAAIAKRVQAGPGRRSKKKKGW